MVKKMEIERNSHSEKESKRRNSIVKSQRLSKDQRWGFLATIVKQRGYMVPSQSRCNVNRVKEEEEEEEEEEKRRHSHT
jgi:hypothetical protein